MHVSGKQEGLSSGLQHPEVRQDNIISVLRRCGWVETGGSWGFLASLSVRPYLQNIRREKLRKTTNVNF